MIGTRQELKVKRESIEGVYFSVENKEEVLLPKNDSQRTFIIGDVVDVFIYKDSNDRLVGTTKEPKIKLEEFAYLQVKQVNRYGAFMDWGISKDLMVPFAEQNRKLQEGDWSIVFLLLDERTDRLIGSCKVNAHVFMDELDVKLGQEVDILPYHRTDLGLNCIVNNLYKGLVFNSDIHQEIILGKRRKAFVKKVRKDGKIDLALEPSGYRKSIDRVSQKVVKVLEQQGGKINLSDNSDPEVIKKSLGMSKKAFKRAIGNLYRQKIIRITKDSIELLT